MKTFSANESNAHPPVAQDDGRLRRAAFRTAAAALPFVILVLVELLLRAFGVLSNEREAFVEVPSREAYVVMNPAYADRYFSGFRPAVPFNPLRRKKSENTFRVMVLGGSSTAGFPYRFPQAFPAQLEALLSAQTSDKSVEVANLGMSAVNSYTIHDLAREALKLEPDALVFYAGHNEYYGAFGVGSTIGRVGNSALLKRLALYMKRSVLYLLLERTLTPDPPEPETQERTLMARVVGNATIELDDAVYRAGLTQFEHNMRGAISVLRNAGVEVFVGTVASNLLGQPPLGDNQDAFDLYADASAPDVDSDVRRRLLVESKERDNLRFRAPEAINEILGELADELGATLVDTRAAIIASSAQGVEGADLFVDHLHLNVRGYGIIAQTFFNAMCDLPELCTVEAHLPPLVGDPISEAFADLNIKRLVGGYPFDKAVAPEESDRRFASLLEARLRKSWADSLAVLEFTRRKGSAEALLAGVRMAEADQDTVTVLQLYSSLLQWQPFNTSLMRQAVSFALTSPNYDDQVAALARYAATRTGDIFFYNALGAASLRVGDIAGADAALGIAEDIDPQSPEMLYNTARLQLALGDTTRARDYFERYQSTQPAQSD